MKHDWQRGHGHESPEYAMSSGYSHCTRCHLVAFVEAAMMMSDECPATATFETKTKPPASHEFIGVDRASPAFKTIPIDDVERFQKELNVELAKIAASTEAIWGPEKATAHIQTHIAQHLAEMYGSVTAREQCDHILKFDRSHDAIVCEMADCDLCVSGQALAAMGLKHRERYDRHGNALADRCQQLADEVVALEAENGRLRRKLERKR